MNIVPRLYLAVEDAWSICRNENLNKQGTLQEYEEGDRNNDTLVDLSCNTVAMAAWKAVIVAAIENKRVKSPIISFVGSRVRNLFSSYCDVRIPRNINTEVVAEKSEIESDIMKTMNKSFSRNIGVPRSLLPLGIVKATANIMVTIRAATNQLYAAASFIHFSLALTKFACCSVNNSLGFFPSTFTRSLQIAA